MVLLSEVEKVYKQRNWWDLIINLQVAKYITYFIANYTKFTPNQVTFTSLLFAILSGIYFYLDYFIIGALLYQLSYILDIVDGALARVTNQTSKLGAFFDVFTDWFKAPILIIEIMYLAGMQTFALIIIFLFYLLSLVNKYNDMLFYTGVKSISKNFIDDNKDSNKSFFRKYIDFCENKNIQLLPSSVEVEGILLFLYPIFKFDFFIYLSILILFMHFILKIVIILRKFK